MAAVVEAEPQPAVESTAPALQEKKATPLQTPLPAPTASSCPAPRPVLMEAQQAKYDWLLKQAQDWKEVPSAPKGRGKGGPVTDDERFWLTRECLLRYLRATKWHEKEAAKRLLDTLSWRREYGVEELTAEHISPENATGKQIVVGYDKQGRPCHYLNPGRQNTEPSPRQVQHLVFMVERVLDIMPPQQETLALLINFKQSKTRSNTAPGIGQGREVLHILQTHYPERLGKALIINVPWVVWGFFKLITPFIDPLTREKLKFNEDMNQYVPSEQLWTEFEGDLEFDYDHSIYWPALTKLARERREARKARWIAGGKHIGELEDYLTGVVEQGIHQSAEAETQAEPPTGTEGTKEETAAVATAEQPGAVVASAETEEAKKIEEAPKMEELTLEDNEVEAEADKPTVKNGPEPEGTGAEARTVGDGTATEEADQKQ